MKIVIAVASPRETDYIPTDDRIQQLIIGVGKLNAYAALSDFFSLLPQEERHQYIIFNAGSCGSLRHPIGSSLIVNHFEQGDTYTNPDFANNTLWLRHHSSNAPKTTLLTSDRFISAHYLQEQHMPADEFDAFEMEGYAIAHYAFQHKLPLYSLKMVSDNCDGNIKDWASIMNDIRPRLTSMMEEKCNEFLALTPDQAAAMYGLESYDHTQE